MFPKSIFYLFHIPFYSTYPLRFLVVGWHSLLRHVFCQLFLHFLIKKTSLLGAWNPQMKIIEGYKRHVFLFI